MDETIEEVPRALPLPTWFRILSWLALAWEAIGCAVFTSQIAADKSQLPIDQQRMLYATPVWSTVAYAAAVIIGLVGAIQLVRRRPSAPGLLLISLIAVIVQFSAYLIDSRLRNLTSDDMLTVPIVIILACFAIFQLSLFAQRRGWLD